MSLPAIDIILPVYNAYDDLRVCLDSVFRTTFAPHRIVLIDDCSPDPRIFNLFEGLRIKQDPRLVLLRNDKNLGFVKTVNLGMSLGRNDILLLNSDTIVTARWLNKIIQCALHDARIGTITPFSNNAEICSFPKFCQDNALPRDLDAEAVNRAMEKAAVPVYPDIPTAVGFCMYIRRKLLDEIGLFDDETFPLGYGEENDFCMRALQKGWRNVLCDDTFIQHVGGSSFDTKKKELTEQNLGRLIDKHPDYESIIQTFIQADPIKPIRGVAQSFLKLTETDKHKPGVLHIKHASSGGTEQHIRSLMMNAHSGYRHYLLLAVDDVWCLKDMSGDQTISYQFQKQSDQLWSSFLADICTSFEINLCHVHQMVHCRLGLLEALRSTDIPFGISVHDFFLACPTVNLLNQEGVYCDNETRLDHCQNCLAAQSDYNGVEIAEWRAQHTEIVERAEFVIAPSQWAADTFRQYFKGASLFVIPHGSSEIVSDSVPVTSPATISATIPKTIPMEENQARRIGVLGAIGPVKGARILENLVKRTRQRNLNLCWVVIGYMDNQFEAYQSADKVLTIHGEYQNGEIECLLDQYNIDLVVYPSAGPETFCYTLTEAWSAGKPALVPPIGALAERVTANQAGWLMTDWRDLDAILDDILSILDTSRRSELKIKQEHARSAHRYSVDEMMEDTESIYSKVVLHRVSGPKKTMSQSVLLAAAQAAVNDNTLPAESSVPAYSWLTRVILYLRESALGQKLVDLIPIGVRRMMKRLFLASEFD